MPEKEWIKPQLIVLVRSSKDEAVLSACKGYSGTSGLTTYQNGCFMRYLFEERVCTECAMYSSAYPIICHPSLKNCSLE